MATEFLEQPTPGIYTYHYIRDRPWYNNFMKIPVFAKAVAAGLFTATSAPSSSVRIDPIRLLDDGSLQWTDRSSLYARQKHSFSYHLLGIEDDKNPDIIHSALYVFSGLYKFSSKFSDPHSFAKFSTREQLDAANLVNNRLLQKVGGLRAKLDTFVPTDIARPGEMSQVDLTNEHDSAVEAMRVTTAIPEELMYLAQLVEPPARADEPAGADQLFDDARSTATGYPYDHKGEYDAVNIFSRPVIKLIQEAKALPKSKFSRSRSQVTGDLKTQTELQLAFQLIDTLTKRVDELEKALLTVGKATTTLLDETPVKQKPEVPVKQKLPSQQRRRKKVQDPNLGLNKMNPNNPSFDPYFNQYGPIPWMDPSRYFNPPSWNTNNPDLSKGYQPMPAKTQPPQAINKKKYVKPESSKFLNPKFKDTPKRESIDFFKKKVATFNTELQKLEPRGISEALNADDTAANSKKRDRIKRGRYRAYKALECLGVTQYSSKSRDQQQYNKLQSQRPPVAQSYYPTNMPFQWPNRYAFPPK